MMYFALFMVDRSHIDNLVITMRSYPECKQVFRIEEGSVYDLLVRIEGEKDSVLAIVQNMRGMEHVRSNLTLQVFEGRKK